MPMCCSINFTIQLSNYGTASATSPRLHLELPAGLNLIDTNPAASGDASGLAWQLGTLAPNQSQTISLTLGWDGQSAVLLPGDSLRMTLSADSGPQADLYAPDNQLELEVLVNTAGTDLYSEAHLLGMPEGVQQTEGAPPAPNRVYLPGACFNLSTGGPGNSLDYACG
ncbi:MAG: hypothetical protein AB4911_15925 [Oscillochloridaceae bacterium umkhey_bin13]